MRAPDESVAVGKRPANADAGVSNAPGASPALRLADAERSGTIPGSVFATLETAIREGRQAEVLYHSLSNDGERWRGLDPYEVFHRGGAWYLVGRCHTHDEARTFRLDRVDEVRLLYGRFDRPPSYSLDAYLEDSWEIYRGERVREAVILFDAELAALLENARHHPRERLRRLSSGQIEYRVSVSHLDEIARWVAGFGGKARAVEPLELRRRVEELGKAVAEAHGRIGPKSSRDPQRSESGVEDAQDVTGSVTGSR